MTGFQRHCGGSGTQVTVLRPRFTANNLGRRNGLSHMPLCVLGDVNQQADNRGGQRFAAYVPWFGERGRIDGSDGRFRILQ